MRNKYCTAFFMAVIVFLLPFSSVHAVPNLGNLSYWYAWQDGVEYGAIARWASAPETKHYFIGGFSNETAFLSHVNTARNTWRNAGISINSTGSDSTANFKIYGGTLAQLQLYEPGLTSSHNGYCNFNNASLEGIWTYNNVTIHETGHGLGWRAHSTYSADVMYGFTNLNPTTLSSRDKNHIKQVYP